MKVLMNSKMSPMNTISTPLLLSSDEPSPKRRAIVHRRAAEIRATVDEQRRDERPSIVDHQRKGNRWPKSDERVGRLRQAGDQRRKAWVGRVQRAGSSSGRKRKEEPSAENANEIKRVRRRKREDQQRGQAPRKEEKQAMSKGRGIFRLPHLRGKCRYRRTFRGLSPRDPQVPQQMLSTTFAGIQTMKHEIARLHEAQAQREKELAGKEEKATVQEEVDKITEEPAPGRSEALKKEDEPKAKPAEKQKKRSESRDRAKNSHHRKRKRRRTAAAEKRSAEIPPGAAGTELTRHGQPRLSATQLKKKGRKTPSSEFVATKTTLDRAKKKKKALLDEAKRHEKDPLPAERGGPEDDSAEFPKAPRHSFGVGQPVVAAIEQLPTASTATSTTTDTAASTSGVPSSLPEMERLLVQYGQEATRKK
ncbi:hypothetical protein GPALN_012318 [Globodera pallida]|nr:hypothetical protein GPALN_012318 [Globodera pallida]